MEPLFLQLFLLANVFAIGVLITLGIQQARAHFRPDSTVHHEAPVSVDPTSTLIRDAHQNYRAILDRSAGQLQQDLDSTNQRLNDTLEKLVTYAVNAEMERYRESLSILQRQNESVIRDSMHETTQQHISLKKHLIKRQAELDEELMTHQTSLEQQLAEHHAMAESQLTERQSQIDKDLQAQQAKTQAQQQDIEAKLAHHQTEIETQLRDHQNKLISAINEREQRIAEIQSELENDLVSRQTAQAALQQKFEDQLAVDIEAKKEFLIKQIDTKLTDAVTSLLIESLGNNIDLGAQGPYLTSLLEAHKDEIKNGVNNV